MADCGKYTTARKVATGERRRSYGTSVLKSVREEANEQKTGPPTIPVFGDALCDVVKIRDPTAERTGALQTLEYNDPDGTAKETTADSTTVIGGIGEKEALTELLLEVDAEIDNEEETEKDNVDVLDDDGDNETETDIVAVALEDADEVTLDEMLDDAELE